MLRQFRFGLSMLVMLSCQARARLPQVAGSFDLAPVTALRERPPAVGAAIESWRPPDVQRVRLDNGLNVAFVKRSRSPIVTVAVAVRAGPVHERLEDASLACLTAALLNRGTEVGPGDKLSELNIKGVLPAVECKNDGVIVTLNRLTSDLPTALSLLGTMIQRPLFDAGSISRAIDEQLEIRSLGSVNLQRHLVQAIYSEIYGEKHPLGREPDYVRGRLQLASAETVRRFYSTLYGPSRALLVVVGATTQEQVTKLAKKEFGAWKDPEVPENTHPPATLTPIDTTYNTLGFLGCSDVAQFAIGVPLVGYAHPDYWALRLIASWLGLQQVSRLNQELRYHRGASYSIETVYGARRDSGEMLILGDLSSESLATSLQYLQVEFHRLGRDGLSAEALETARSALVGGLAHATYTNSGVASLLARSFLVEGPLDDIEQIATAVAAVTPAGTRTAAAHHLRPSRAALAICGDPNAVNPALVNFGAIKWFELQ